MKDGALPEDVRHCRRCPRLVAWRERVATEKRAAFREETYWGRPVPAFGDPGAPLMIVGLAPAAHGANRTGRMFTGDRSGDWLYGALHRAGFASQAESKDRDDGLELRRAYVTAAVRCAPPANKPTPLERENCRPYLEREIEVMAGVRVLVALGGYAWSQILRVVADQGWSVPRPRPRFGHAVELKLEHPGWHRAVTLIGSYHPSQQNTFTGTLTRSMFDAVWTRAAALLAEGTPEKATRGPT